MRGSGWADGWGPGGRGKSIGVALIIGLAAGCKGGGGGSDCRTGMIPVPAGDFVMGCADAGVCGEDEAPVRRVAVPAFEVDSCEVTVAQYAACVQAGACTAPSSYSPQCNYGAADRASHPVNCVTHDQARAFCAWAGKRLCTEAEWEKAARGGCERYGDCDKDSPLWPWGAEEPSCGRAVYAPCSCRGTCEAGTRPDGASPYGALDMAGNVWEWVADTYHETYDGAPGDGSAWEGGKGRVFRGGSFLSPAGALRVTNRSFLDPADNTDALGFRCCRTPTTPGPAPHAFADVTGDLPPDPGQDTPGGPAGSDSE